MSATVTYKNDTLTTVDNETKTLTTAGTWLEDDIEISDQSTKLVIVDSPASNNSTIRNMYTVTGVKLQTAKTYTITTSPQTISPDTGYDAFADGVVLTATNGAFLSNMDAYVGDYQNDVISLTSGKVDKYYRRIYGR